ncbi:type III polyketide synthase [Streptomyces sp. NPDC047829]|uniref:type III polyketide synthase n=1 Tax=Streptomyces sp. NPDC047829 TaxID=3154609 RepID=UPI0033D548DA
MTTIISVRGLLPPHCYSQAEFADITLAHFPDPIPYGSKTVSHAAARRMFNNSGVRQRHAVQPLADSYAMTSAARVSRLQREKAAEHGAAALSDALAEAGLRPDEVDLLATTSYMAIGAPPWDLDVVRLAGLRSDVHRLPLHGIGCAAGAAMISRMHDYLTANPGHVAVGVASEAPTLVFGQREPVFSRLVETTMFGDGSAAVVMTGAERPPPAAARPRVVSSLSLLLPDSADLTGWNLAEDGLETFLGPGLPPLVESSAPQAVERLLSPRGLTTDDIGVWVCHPGSARVMDSLVKGLSLTDDAIALSRSLMQRTGNMVSASVLHVLADTLKTMPPAGSWGLMTAFGPGIVAELVLLRWDAPHEGLAV